MKAFELFRKGEKVAEGIEFTNGQITMHWLQTPDWVKVSHYENMAELMDTHKTCEVKLKADAP